MLNPSNTACAFVEDDVNMKAHHHPSKTHAKNGLGSAQNDHQHLHKTRKESDDDRKLNTLERMYSTASEQTTDIEEVWFAVSINFLRLFFPSEISIRFPGLSLW